MHCSYCDIAYALADPNCRGCGAPKTADGVRRDLDVELQQQRSGFSSREESDHGLFSYLERLETLSPLAIVAIVVTILGIVSMLGPSGLIMLAILVPKMMTAKAESNNAMLDQRDRLTKRSADRSDLDEFAKYHAGFKS